MSKKKPPLGRGLGALLGNTTMGSNTKKQDMLLLHEEQQEGEKRYKEIPVEFIIRGKHQPRKDVEQEPLEELAQSIKNHGVMQPIFVRPVATDKYELIAGERRWRACQIAGVANIPAIIQKVTDSKTVAAMSLIENIQREDLNPMEQALAMESLKEKFGLTQQEIADSVGKSRASVANTIRLNNLEVSVKTMLKHGDLEMGHARALLSLPLSEQKEAAQTVVLKSMSARQTETFVRNLLEKKQQSTTNKKQDPNLIHLEEKLSSKLGARVEVKQISKEKGKLVIRYQSLDELDGIISKIK